MGKPVCDECGKVCVSRGVCDYHTIPVLVGHDEQGVPDYRPWCEECYTAIVDAPAQTVAERGVW